MGNPAILGLTTGVPAGPYAQSDILEHFLKLQGPANRRGRAMRAIFERAGVGFRYMVASEGYFSQERTTQARNDLYMGSAIPLGEDTIRRGLDAVGCAPNEIDDLFVVSCTGFNIPGLDLHVARRLGMRPDLRRTCVLGMGCYAAFPALLRAREATAARPGRLAVVLALELCSLHMQLDDTAENVVSSALFADGAAMALVGDDPARVGRSPYGTPRLIHSATYCDYQTLEHMAFTVTDHGYRMYLSSYVPELLASQIDRFVDGMLAEVGLGRGDVRFWGVHPGSDKIVDYVQAKLGLTDAQVEDSHGVLYDYGNMSSATILFVLERIQRCGKPSPGDYGVLLAFGPGLTMEGLLVQW